MNGRARGTETGFTLIEVLISLSIGVVLILLLSETLSATQAGRTRATQLSGALEREGDAIRILRHTLAYMLPPTPDGREHFIVATAESLEFFTLPPQSRGTEGVMHAQIAIKADGDGRFALVLELAPTAPVQRFPEHASRHTLLAGLASAHLSYVFTETTGVTDLAIRRNGTPTLVIINWTYPDGDAGDSRELAVRPRLNLSGRCHLDMASGTCRAS